MTEPRELLGFVQDALVFQDRDDVDERVEYYEVYNNGSIVIVPPRPGVSVGRKVINEVRLTFGDFGPLGSLDAGQSFTNDPRKGRVTNGVKLSERREVLTAIQTHLKKAYDFNPANYGAGDAWSIWLQVRDVEQSRVDGESFGDAFGRLTFEDGPNGATIGGTEWLQNIRGDAPPATEPGDAADAGTTGSDRGPSVADAARTQDQASGLGTDLGAGTGIGENNLQAGGQDGKVTGALLKEFVNSDFAFAFNASINELRDANTAGIFLSWMQDNFVRIRGIFLGEIGQAALNGEVPQGSFADFLRRQGVLSGEQEGGTNPGFESFVDNLNASAAGSSGSGAGAVGPLPAGSPAISPSAGQGPGLTPSGQEEPLPEAVTAVLGIEG